MYAVISDIHGNFEALEAVLRDMPGDVDTVYCLGDVIGYGASPNECCEAVRELGMPTITGNHDLAVTDLSTDLNWFNPVAAAAVMWTRDQLTEENAEFLRSRPRMMQTREALFVHGAVLGWHRRQVVHALRRHGRWIAGAVLAVAALAAYVRLHELGLSPFGRAPDWWRAWDREHFSKAYLDAARLVSMVAFAAVAYLALRSLPATVERAVAPVLLALGRNSFYVFIVHVFVLVAVASVPSSGANALVQLAVVALLVLMVRGRVLFRLIPR